jgi:hypothetical protein
MFNLFFLFLHPIRSFVTKGILLFIKEPIFFRNREKKYALLSCNYEVRISTFMKQRKPYLHVEKDILNTNKHEDS